MVTLFFFSLFFLDIPEMLQMMLNNNQPINQYSPTYGIGFIKAGQQIEHMVGGWLYFPEKKNIVIFNIMHTVRFWYNLYQLLSWPKEFRIYVGFCFDFSLFRAYRINNIPIFFAVLS